MRVHTVRVLSMALLAVAVATLGYRLLAPLAAPRIAHLALERLAAGTGQWTARVQRIDYEPFALAFELHDLQLSASEGDAVAGSPLVLVDFSLRSLISMRPVLDRVDIRDGNFRRTPNAALVYSSLLRVFAADMHIALLDAEVADARPAAVDGTQRILQVHVEDLDLAAGRGALAVTASSMLGDGSRLDAELTLRRSNGGPLLHGTATLARAQLPLGAWSIAAPSAAISVDAELSPQSVAASFVLLGGTLAAIDRRTADARFELTGAGANGSWQLDTNAYAVNASASLASGGRAELALAHGPNGGLQLDSQLIAVPATLLAPYVARALGVEPASGIVDADVSVRSGEPSDSGFARVTAHTLRLVASEPIAATALALLEEPDGAISMDVTLEDGRATDQIVEHVRERVLAVSMAPFETLAALVGRDAADIAAIEFVPGTAEPTPRGQDSIADLAAALHSRQRVGVQVEAREGSELDRGALARSQVMLHVTLATARAERPGAAAPIEFASPRVQGVLDEFAGERLSAETLEEIGMSSPFDAAAPPAAPERVAYYRSLFGALVAREPIADTTLRRLADFRVRVAERRLRDLGIAAERIASDAVVENGAGLALLPLALEPAPISEALPP